MRMLAHTHFSYMGETLLERQVFKAPHEPTKARGEAVTFLHLVNGAGVLHTPTRSYPMAPSDSAILTPAGKGRIEWNKNADGAPHAALLVHFHPDVLLAGFQGVVPEMFRLTTAATSHHINRIAIDQHVSNYIAGLEFYFRKPELMNDELMVLKVKELLCLLVHSEEADAMCAITSQLFDIALQRQHTAS